MKKIGVLAAVLAMAFLCVGVAQAEMYVEGYIGAAGAFNNLGQTVTIHDNPSFSAICQQPREDFRSTRCHRDRRPQAGHLVRQRGDPGLERLPRLG